MKTKKSKKKIKNLILKIFLVVIVLAIISAGGLYFLTAEDEDNSLTLLEKQWIDKNKSTLVDINIPNNIDIYAKDGSGILFSFIDYVESTTDLSLNKKPYSYPNDELTGLSLAIISNNDDLKDSDLFIFDDNFVVIGINNTYFSSIDEINNKTVGVLENDYDIINNALNNRNISLKKYASIDTLYKGLKNNELSYVVTPRYAYLTNINKNELYVNHTLENISNKCVLRLGSNEKVNVIISKLLNNWQKESFQESFETYLVNFYSKNNSFSELDRSTLNNRVYKYGYLDGDSYNITSNKKIYGVAGEYLNSLITMADMEFEYIPYNSVDELKKDLDNNKLDLAFINFSYDNEDYKKTSSPFNERFVVLANRYYSINDVNGLINNKLFIKSNNYLYDYIVKNVNSSVKTIKKYSSSISIDGLLVLDENDYLLLKDNTLESYQYLFTDTYIGNNCFIVKNTDDVLYNLLNYVLNNSNYNAYQEEAINNLFSYNSTKDNFKGLYMIIIGIIVLPILVVLLCTIIIKSSKNLKITKRESILKYNDVLTSLKNRNYLNDNINSWDNTKIYPRTIVIIDLNNLKYVNDNYGHEEGNELIKKAAAVLINTQLEKSDIIRTDGNEFLIYLIGYSKTQVSTYLSKLSKEFEKLPYGFGAAVGYSMITDEIKTIDDAINEATIEMRMDKEKNYR